MWGGNKPFGTCVNLSILYISFGTWTVQHFHQYLHIFTEEWRVLLRGGFVLWVSCTLFPAALGCAHCCHALLLSLKGNDDRGDWDSAPSDALVLTETHLVLLPLPLLSDWSPWTIHLWRTRRFFTGDKCPSTRWQSRAVSSWHVTRVQIFCFSQMLLFSASPVLDAALSDDCLFFCCFQTGSTQFVVQWQSLTDRCQFLPTGASFTRLGLSLDLLQVSLY